MMSRCLLALILPVVLGKIEYKINVNKGLGLRQITIIDIGRECVMILQLPANALSVIGDVMESLMNGPSVIDPCIDVRTAGTDKTLSWSRPTFDPLPEYGGSRHPLTVYIRRYVTDGSSDEKYLNCKLMDDEYKGEKLQLAKSYFGEFFSQYRFVPWITPKNRNINPASYLKSTLPRLRFCRVMAYRWVQLLQLVDEILGRRRIQVGQIREEEGGDDLSAAVSTTVHDIEPHDFVDFEKSADAPPVYYLKVGRTGVCEFKIRFDPLSRVIEDQRIRDAIELAILGNVDPCAFETSCNEMAIPYFKRHGMCTSDRLSTHVLYFYTDSRMYPPFQSCACLESVRKAEKLFNLIGARNGSDGWDPKMMLQRTSLDAAKDSFTARLPPVNHRDQSPHKPALTPPTGNRKGNPRTVSFAMAPAQTNSPPKYKVLKS
jgi:hypothetical protein